MKTLYLEPTIKNVPIMLGDTVTKVDIIKVADKKIRKIAKKYEKQKTPKEIELEELKEDLLFLLKEFNADGLKADRIRELRDEIKEAKKRVIELEEETEKERDELEEEKAKELCLLVAGDNKKTAKFFEKVAEENSWQELSIIIRQAFEAYEAGKLKD